MLKFTARILSVLVLAFVISSAFAQEDDMVDEETVAAVTAVIVDDYGEYVNNHDAEGYVTMYTEDVLWAPPNGPDQTDAEGIQAAVQGLFDKQLNNSNEIVYRVTGTWDEPQIELIADE